MPGSRVSFADGAGPDLRNYRVDFSKLAETFPDLSLRWSVRDGVDELVGAYAKYGLTYDDFISSRFVRLRRIRELLSAGLLDEMLRRQAAAQSRTGRRDPFTRPLMTMPRARHASYDAAAARLFDMARRGRSAAAKNRRIASSGGWRPGGPPSWLGCRGPGDVQHQQLRR